MTKIAMLVGIVAVGLFAFSTAFAAVNYAKHIPRATLVGVVDRGGEQFPIHKHVDGGTACYVFASSISCVK